MRQSACASSRGGVCFGGHLTAYIEDLRTGHVDIQQVKAAETYFAKDGYDE